MQAFGRCRFVRAPADDLAALAPGSVDVVTTSSVLIYVQAKQQALHEFFRVLRPGGWLSLFEPINRFCYPEPPRMLLGYDVTRSRRSPTKCARSSRAFTSLRAAPC